MQDKSRVFAEGLYENVFSEILIHRAETFKVYLWGKVSVKKDDHKSMKSEEKKKGRMIVIKKGITKLFIFYFILFKVHARIHTQTHTHTHLYIYLYI